MHPFRLSRPRAQEAINSYSAQQGTIAKAIQSLHIYIYSSLSNTQTIKWSSYILGIEYYIHISNILRHAPNTYILIANIFSVHHVMPRT